MHFKTFVPLKVIWQNGRNWSHLVDGGGRVTVLASICQFFKFGEQSEAENLKQVKYTWKNSNWVFEIIAILKIGLRSANIADNKFYVVGMFV